MRCLGLRGIGSGLVGVLALASVSCGSMDGTTDEGTAGGATNETAALFRRHRQPPPPPPTGTGGTTGTGGSTGGSSSGLTTEQVIAAVQTADGRAIPQAAGPNGACPEVVVRLGFWSCPTIGQTCTSTNPVRHCVCSRTDGEGQNATWICQ
jgi:hypothetical protein